MIEPGSRRTRQPNRDHNSQQNAATSGGADRHHSSKQTRRQKELNKSATHLQSGDQRHSHHGKKKRIEQNRVSSAEVGVAKRAQASGSNPNGSAHRGLTSGMK
jgi:hypothetical protein